MRFRFHGMTLAVEGDPRAVAAAAELLGALPPDASPGVPDLRIVFRPSPPFPRPAGPRRFYHGILDCHADGDDLVLWDGHSIARVVAGGALIEVHVADESMRDGYLFAHVFLLISLVTALRWRGLFHLPGVGRMAERIPLAITDVRAVGADWRLTARPGAPVAGPRSD